MPINFVPRERSSFDEGSGVSILRPRMLPASEPGLEMEVGYQYTFLQGGRDVGGLGFLGVLAVGEVDGRKTESFTMDLRRDLVIQSILRFQARINNQDDAFDFISGLAQGLLNCFALQTENELERRYLAFTDAAVLSRQQVAIRDDVVVDEQGRVTLATLAVPAHAS